MLKIKRKTSVTLSLILALMVGIVGTVGLFLLPSLVEKLIIAKFGAESFLLNLSPVSDPLLVALAYIALLCILCADVLMILLLLRVRDSKVFSEKSVGLIRGVSWCSMLLGATFIVIGLYFALGFVVAGLAIFLGLCLRVVKNVIEEAIAIKSENDFTV